MRNFQMYCRDLQKCERHSVGNLEYLNGFCRFNVGELDAGN